MVIQDDWSPEKHIKNISGDTQYAKEYKKGISLPLMKI